MPHQVVAVLFLIDDASLDVFVGAILILFSVLVPRRDSDLKTGFGFLIEFVDRALILRWRPYAALEEGFDLLFKRIPR